MRRLDPELKAHLEAMEQRLASKADLTVMRDELSAAIRTVDAKVDALTERVDRGFAARKEDEDTAFREIDGVKGRVARLETRLGALERRKS